MKCEECICYLSDACVYGGISADGEACGEMVSDGVKPAQWRKISPAGIWECSKCGGVVMTSEIELYRYCHRCGVEMEG